MNQTEVFFSTKEVAARLGVGADHVRWMAHRGVLKAYKHGHHVLVKEADLEAYIQSKNAVTPVTAVPITPKPKKVAR